MAPLPTYYLVLLHQTVARIWALELGQLRPFACPVGVVLQVLRVLLLLFALLLSLLFRHLILAPFSLFCSLFLTLLHLLVFEGFLSSLMLLFFCFLDKQSFLLISSHLLTCPRLLELARRPDDGPTMVLLPLLQIKHFALLIVLLFGAKSLSQALVLILKKLLLNSHVVDHVTEVFGFG
jgi:hypothetical protein